MKSIYFIGVFILSVFITSCSNDDTVLETSPNVPTRSVNNSLVDYLTVEDGQWVLELSQQEAVAMGKSADYLKLIDQMKQINNRLKELQNNPKATIGFNLPTNERIVMRSGKVLSRTVNSPITGTRAGSTLLKTMTANESTSFNTRSEEYKITSHAYVQSMFLWSFELRDDAWNNYWNESGVASKNLDHEWIYALTRPGYDNFWRFSSTGTQTDGTNITFSFYK